jgi:hypothetical protein
MGRYDSWAALTDQFMFNHPDFLAMFAAGNGWRPIRTKTALLDDSVGSPTRLKKRAFTVGFPRTSPLPSRRHPETDERPPQRRREVGRGAPGELAPLGKIQWPCRLLQPWSDRRWSSQAEIVAPGTNIVSVRDKHAGVDPR